MIKQYYYLFYVESDCFSIIGIIFYESFDNYNIDDIVNDDYLQFSVSKSLLFFFLCKGVIEREYFFFIKRVVGHGSMQNVKDSNDNEGAGDVFLILKMDPRTVSTPTELAEFTVPGDFNHIEVLNFGVNLPPVQGVANNYEAPIGTKPEPVTININLGNQPTDNSLPKTNTKI
jgi:hypothetical protein